MQIHILQGFPGIGPGNARKLIEKFGTINNVLQASENQLLEVSGIPQKTIKRILELSN
jgi:Fanconi anemia group M protein